MNNDYIRLAIFNANDLKLTILNVSVIAISFSNVENFLKIILLLVSIIYTSYKVFELHRNYKKEKADESSRISKQIQDTTKQ